MKRNLTEEELTKLKADKKERDKFRAHIEEKMHIGQVQPYSVDARGTWGRISHRVATEDAIRHYCHGLGDVNPLYRSRDYAKNSIHGGIVAPPSFICAISWLTGIGAKVLTELEHNVGGWEAGNRTEWFKVIREGDEFTVFEIPTEARDITREGTALQFLIRGDRYYKNQRGEIVAILHGSWIMTFTSRPKESDLPKLLERVKVHEQHYFSEKEVEDWYRLVVGEEIRGANPRYWEDVNVGDQLPSTHHVCTMMEFVAFAGGASMGCASWRFQMAQNMGPGAQLDWKRRRDPESGLPDFTIEHHTDIAAQRLGWPRALGSGVQMNCWMTHLITNWMGDAGFLKAIETRIRRPLHRESLALCKGEVAKKYIEGDKHLVDLHITVEDHLGELMIPNGSATVVLPSRHM